MTAADNLDCHDVNSVILGNSGTVTVNCSLIFLSTAVAASIVAGVWATVVGIGAAATVVLAIGAREFIGVVLKRGGGGGAILSPSLITFGVTP